MKQFILIDHCKCTGCDMCGMACSFSKTNVFNLASSRIKIIRREESGLTMPMMCQHCAEPVCVACCPLEAMSKDEHTGLVDINRQTCNNCKICRMVCPFGGPSLEPIAGEVVICDHCGGDPACVNICPTGALQYVPSYKHNTIGRRKAMGEIRKLIVALSRS